MEHWDTIATERRALADDLEGLTAEQWEQPSLCGDWTVRHLAGHLVVPHVIKLRTFAVEIAKAAGNFDRANSRLAIREGQRPTAELVADLRRHAESHFHPPGFGSEAPLTDILVHGYDIRLPLGLPAERPPAPFRHALDLLVSPKARRGFVAKGRPPARLVATDLDWSHGDGDEVSGTAADLALALLRRSVRLDTLSGPGAPALAAWVEA